MISFAHLFAFGMENNFPPHRSWVLNIRIDLIERNKKISTHYLVAIAIQKEHTYILRTTE